MVARYDVRAHGERWIVFDTIAGSPATVDGVWQVDLAFEDPDDLADLLSGWYAKEVAAAEH